MAEAREQMAAKFELILPHLDERQRRLLMGAEALVLGHGGIRAVARAGGFREATVAQGAAELEAGAAPLGRVRRVGGGRKRLVETDPGLSGALLSLVEPEERGDPMSPLRWTTKSLRTLAGELTAQGHRVGPDTVAALLHEQGFSLQANAKTLEGKQHPDRDAQFRYLNEQVKDHQDSGDPVASIDSKKKEQVGNFATAGRTWRPGGEPVRVRDHDFAVEATGVAVPYGVYDLSNNTGWVNVGTDHNTAAFAVESIRRWWASTGCHDHPEATRLLITADAGGSNGYRTRTWKAGLADLALETGLQITVCHFPPGTSKWNKIEHRLFSHITMNWRGRPLSSHDVVVESIAATTTSAGLRVHAELDTTAYALGVKISDSQWAALPVHGHEWHGDWNYTLQPQPYQYLALSSTPTDQPTPALAWLTHPTLTGLSRPEWDALIAVLIPLYDTHRQAGRKPGRPFQRGPHSTNLTLTFADHLTATLIYHHLGLPQTILGSLYGVRSDTLNRHISLVHALLHQAGHTLQPGPHHLTTLDQLYAFAESHEIITHQANTPS